ncbi:recombination-associated protein RdgC [Psychrobium sp. 1_MG-2023]|uniref:recombination-associated protein RdgC n=1 Tax=Psychrobium sp. 1_MG-2023 TaxID=3062624 RepID=UPI000C3483C7|nr:recombination-associated protein RdgC [Psychrobium sp. 1_MG-2023]MDP2560925.1 recombination-associated protein RdgC [Psychrobium sp. 1_MG-2023]PKF55999.1 recombination-associated protein RdgC [Alteromonadales bacterium alter-6D02]
MWFKNLIIYRLSNPIDLTPEQLETRLEEFAFRPCTSQEQSKYGWAKPMGKHGHSLLHVTNDNILLCARKEDKMLPASVIKEALDEKVEMIEQETARPVKKKEKDALKEEIVHSLLPRAFSRLGSTFAYIAPKQGLIVVDASSHNKAEDLLALLRKSIGSLQVLPAQSKVPVDQTMTQWLTDELPLAPFSLLEEAELKSPLENGAVLRCKNQDLITNEIKAHIDNGMFVVKAALQYAESLTFILSEDLTVKRVKFTDVVTEQQEDQDKEDKAACFDADFAIMTGEFEQFIPALFEVLGGEEQAQ